MTVNQAIEFFTKHGQKKIVKKLAPLQDVGLGYIKLGQSSSTLSGGENQRVKLAYYLSQEKADPTLFIFDEPTRGIDVGSKYEIYKLINELAEQGVAIIMISSEMPEVLGMSDRIMVMYEGRVTGEIGISEANQEVLMHMASNTYERYKQELIEQEEK